MAENMRPASDELAPDTARTYERAWPEAESVSGQLDKPEERPSTEPDRMHHAVTNRQENRQLNSDDVVNTDGNAIPHSGQAAHGGETGTTEATRDHDMGHTR